MTGARRPVLQADFSTLPTAASPDAKCDETLYMELEARASKRRVEDREEDEEDEHEGADHGSRRTNLGPSPRRKPHTSDHHALICQDQGA